MSTEIILYQQRYDPKYTGVKYCDRTDPNLGMITLLLMDTQAGLNQAENEYNVFKIPIEVHVYTHIHVYICSFCSSCNLDCCKENTCIDFHN